MKGKHKQETGTRGLAETIISELKQAIEVKQERQTQGEGMKSEYKRAKTRHVNQHRLGEGRRVTDIGETMKRSKDWEVDSCGQTNKRELDR